MEMRFEKEVVDKDPNASSIHDANGGWGRGSRIVGDRMGQVKEACVNSGKNVVFLCHSAIRQHQAVDMSPYNILTLNLSKNALPHFVDLVDCVGFLRLKVYDHRGGKEKVVLSTSSRELICHAHATITSKNRLKINKPLDCPEGSNPIVDYIKANMKG